MSVIAQDGDSALMRAALWGKTEVCVELVKAGANVDIQDNVCQPNYLICGMYIICTVGAKKNSFVQQKVFSSSLCFYCISVVYCLVHFGFFALTQSPTGKWH